MPKDTYYVTFASDVHDVICVAVPARDAQHAIEEVRSAIGMWVDCLVFEFGPSYPIRACWSIDELEDYYDNP